MDNQEKPQNNDLIKLTDVDNTNPVNPSITQRIYHRLHRFSGVWYMMLSSILFTACMFAVKLVPADMFDIMLVRFFLQAVVFGCFAQLYKGYNIFHTYNQPFATSMNFIMATFTNLLYLAAYYFLPLADLNIVKHTYIIWSTILAVLFLKDRFTIMNAITLLLALLGLFVATNPDLVITSISRVISLSIKVSNNTTDSTVKPSINISSYYYLGILLASLSALTKAILVVARKHLVKAKQPHSVMNFHFTLSGFFMSTVYCIVRRFWRPEPFAWKWALTAGSVFGFIQLLTNTLFAKALKRENVQLLSILGSLDIIYAVLLEYIVYKATKSWLFFIGAGLVILSATMLSIDHHRKTANQTVKQVDEDADAVNLTEKA